MSKLYGGIQIAAGLMMLALSGLCGAMIFGEMIRQPAHLANPLLWISVLLFIGALGSIRQGWQRIRGTYVSKRSRASRWVSAVLMMFLGLGWIALQGLRLIGLTGLGRAASGIALSQIIPGAIIFLAGVWMMIQLIRTRDEI